MALYVIFFFTSSALCFVFAHMVELEGFVLWLHLQVSLLTDNGSTKDDLKLPTDEALLTQLKNGFEEGKDIVVSVMSAMGEEQMCALKEVGPK